MLDLDALRTTPINTRPWRWSVLPGAFRDGADDLVEHFPADGFTLFRRTDDAKPYLMSGRPLVERGAPTAQGTAGLHPAWRQLAGELLHPSYRETLGQAFGRDLGGLLLEATFWRYDAGCWLAPHPDKPEKVISQVFYFNPEWDAAWGGMLRVLRSADLDDVECELAPVAGSVVTIERSDHSWHAVTPVVSDRAPARVSLQVAFYLPKPGPEAADR
jgi:2OG-Fe(II) oxygenase superfamily